MTTQPNRTTGSFEPASYLELAGRIDWRESGSSAGSDVLANWNDPSEPQDLPWAA